MKAVLKAEKREAENLTRLHLNTSLDKPTFEDFRRVLGSIAWPRMPFPGIILIGGEQQSGGLIVFEEVEFRTVSQAAGYMDSLWDQYLPEKYYDIPEDDAFYTELAKLINDAKKRPLTSTIFAGDIEYGNQLIADYLSKNLLRVPANGVLAGQLETVMKEGSRPDLNLYGVEALRYLLTGFNQYPWKSPVSLASRRYPLSLEEIISLEIESIRVVNSPEYALDSWDL